MPKPMGNDNYNNIAKNCQGCNESRGRTKDGRCIKRSEAIMKSLITSVSVDGTWQERGFEDTSGNINCC